MPWKVDGVQSRKFTLIGIDKMLQEPVEDMVHTGSIGDVLGKECPRHIYFSEVGRGHRSSETPYTRSVFHCQGRSKSHMPLDQNEAQRLNSTGSYTSSLRLIHVDMRNRLCQLFNLFQPRRHAVIIIQVQPDHVVLVKE